MKFEKKLLGQWLQSGCERQIGLGLHTDAELKADRETGSPLGLPHRQRRPMLLQLLADAGNKWPEKKNADLLAVFGEDSVNGLRSGLVVDETGSPVTACYESVPLEQHLDGLRSGQFLLEAEFSLSPTFKGSFGLDDWPKNVGLTFSDVRPDVIEVGAASRFPEIIDHTGLITSPSDDHRDRLRVINVKLTSTPGPGNFIELAFYSTAFAAWLEDNGWSSRFAVSADAAVWGGSYDLPSPRQASLDGATGDGLYQALDADLEMVPLDVFVPNMADFLTQKLEPIANAAAVSGWQETLDWHVQKSCANCEFLGQTFKPLPENELPDGEVAGFERIETSMDARQNLSADNTTSATPVIAIRFDMRADAFLHWGNIEAEFRKANAIVAEAFIEAEIGEIDWFGKAVPYLTQQAMRRGDH